MNKQINKDTHSKHKQKFSSKQRKIIKVGGCIILALTFPIGLWLFIAAMNLLISSNADNAENFGYILLTNSVIITGILGGGIIAIALILFILLRNFEPTIKNKSKSASSPFGSADWLTYHEIQREFPKKTLQSPHHWGWVFHTARIKSKKSTDIYFNATPNKHGLVIGSTGSGKTQNVILPSIIFNLSALNRPTLIVTDPKGAIEKAVSPIIKANNYQKFVFDFINFAGNHWNPLLEIQKLWNADNFDEAEIKIDSLVNNLTTQIQSLRDPIWHMASGSLITAVIFCNLLEAKNSSSPLTFDMIIDTLSQTVADLRDLVSKWYLDCKPLRRCSNIIFENEEPKFLETVKKNAEVCLKNLRSEKFAKMSATNDLDIKSLSEGGKIIFLRTHITDNTYWFLNQIFISALLNEIIHSDRISHKTPILFCLDEFGNIPQIPAFNNVLSTAREYNIWFLLVIQSYNQLERYSYARDLIANCHLKYYLHTNNVETAKKIEQEYGQKTIKVSSYNYGKIANTHNIGRPLIDYYDLMHLQKNTMIVKLELHNPWQTSTLPFFQYKTEII